MLKGVQGCLIAPGVGSTGAERSTGVQQPKGQYRSLRMMACISDFIMVDLADANNPTNVTATATDEWREAGLPVCSKVETNE